MWLSRIQARITLSNIAFATSRSRQAAASSTAAPPRGPTVVLRTVARIAGEVDPDERFADDPEFGHDERDDEFK
jgi:hypothetical protein